MVMQNFGVTNKEHYGLCEDGEYFLVRVEKDHEHIFLQWEVIWMDECFLSKLPVWTEYSTHWTVKGPLEQTAAICTLILVIRRLRSAIKVTLIVACQKDLINNFLEREYFQKRYSILGVALRMRNSLRASFLLNFSSVWIIF